MANEIGRNIRRYRERKNYKQNELAKMLGISNVVLSRYENGTRTPDPETLQNIVDILEITTDQLYGRDVISDFRNSEVLMFKDKEGWDNLSEDEQNEIIKQLSAMADFYIAQKNSNKE